MIGQKRPVIFVTDDLKPDWWQWQGQQRIGPRLELVAEMYRVAEVRFHLVTSEDFLRHAQKHLGIEHDDAVINEVREVVQSARQHGSAAVTRGVGRIPGLVPGAATAFESIAGGSLSWLVADNELAYGLRGVSAAELAGIDVGQRMAQVVDTSWADKVETPLDAINLGQRLAQMVDPSWAAGLGIHTGNLGAFDDDEEAEEAEEIAEDKERPGSPPETS